jgi:hypothetical protein
VSDRAVPPVDAGAAGQTGDGGGRLFHLRHAVGMSRTAIAALLALASGGLALFFQLRPDLAPDPRSHLGAEVTVFSVDRSVTLGGYLARRRAIVSPTKLARERAAYVQQADQGVGGDGSSILTTPGEDVFVRLQVEGFKSRSIAMLASLYNAKTRRRVAQIADWSVFEEQLGSPSDQSVVEFWLPAPPVSVAKYFVRVEVYHRGDGVLLAVTDSKPIRAD